MCSQKTDARLEELQAFMREVLTKERTESYLIAILHKAQALYGYLDRRVMDEVALTMNIPTAHIWGVATFYHYFKLAPSGKHTIYMCLGTACFVKGADAILAAIKDRLGIDIGQTTEDGMFTLQETRCLGACGLAPVIMIDDKMYGELTPTSAVEILEKIRKEK